VTTKALDAPTRTARTIGATGDDVRAAVADIVEAHARDLVAVFYATPHRGPGDLPVPVGRSRQRVAQNRQLPITASIGVATFYGRADFNRLLQSADQALYRANELDRFRSMWAEASVLDKAG
jgi:predicted signal transduction protein with EAL and GGDEF domain